MNPVLRNWIPTAEMEPPALRDVQIVIFDFVTGQWTVEQGYRRDDGSWSLTGEEFDLNQEPLLWQPMADLPDHLASLNALQTENQVHSWPVDANGSPVEASHA